MYPATIDSAFLATYFGTRTAARYEAVTDLPIGNRSVTIKSLGVRQNLDFELAFGPQWAAGVSLLGQFLTGVTGESLATQGAIYGYGATVNGAVRIARIDSSATQIAFRLAAFGVQGGGRVTVGPLLRALRNTTISNVPDILGNFGSLLVTPVSWFGVGASIDVAQALGPVVSLQGSFRLDLHRFTASPFVPGQGRVDQSSTEWLPQAGVALGVNPEGWPVAFLGEYRITSQDSSDPTSPATHLAALGGYYDARTDLQLGAVILGEFGFPALQGIDANGNPVGSDRGEATSAEIVMRYIW